jgi:hypothetical protein
MNPSLQKNRNFYDIHGSSETIRKTTFFSFDTFSPPSHIKKIDHSFLEWFIGFVEGSPHTCIQGSPHTCIQGSPHTCIQGFFFGLRKKILSLVFKKEVFKYK